MNVDTGMSFVHLFFFCPLTGIIDTQWAYLIGIRVRDSHHSAGVIRSWP